MVVCKVDLDGYLRKGTLILKNLRFWFGEKWFTFSSKLFLKCIALNSTALTQSFYILNIKNERFCS
jgi:hypothetical protein